MEDVLTLEKEINFKKRALALTELFKSNPNIEEIVSQKFQLIDPTEKWDKRQRLMIVIRVLMSFKFGFLDRHFMDIVNWSVKSISNHLTNTEVLIRHKKDVMTTLKFLSEFLIFYKNHTVEFHINAEFEEAIFVFLRLDLPFDFDEFKFICSLIIGVVLCFYVKENQDLMNILLQSEPEKPVDVPMSKILKECTANQESLVLILGGVLQSNPLMLMEKLEKGGSSFMYLIFNQLSKMIQNCGNSQLLIFSFQSLNCYFRVLQKLPIETVRSLLREHRIIEDTIDFIMINWTNAIVSKQKLKETFGFLVDTLVQLGAEEEMGNDKLRTLIINLETGFRHTKIYYELLSLLIPKISLKVLIQIVPDVHLNAIKLLKNPNLNSFISIFLVQFFRKAKVEFADDFNSVTHQMEKLHFDETVTLVKSRAELESAGGKVNLQLDVFVQAIAQIMLEKESIVKRILLDRIILKLAEVEPQILNLIFNQIGTVQYKTEYYYEAMLQLLKYSKEVNFELEYFKDSKNALNYQQLIKIGIESFNINLQVQTYLLLLEERNPSKDDLEMIKLYLINQSIKGDDFESRMTVDAKLKKFLETLKRLIYRSFKEISNNHKKRIYLRSENEEDVEYEVSMIDSEIQELEEGIKVRLSFFDFLLDYSFLMLFPSPNYYRKLKAKTILMMVKQTDELIIDKSANLVIPKLFKLSKEKVNVLFTQIIFESFGEVRADLFSILESVEYECDYTMGIFLMGKLRTLMNSIRAADVDIMTSLTKLLYQKFVVSKAFLLQFDQQKSGIGSDPRIHFVNEILDALEEHLQAAKENIVKASLKSPLNGIFHALEALLEIIEYVGHVDQWQPTLTRLVNLCEQSCLEAAKICSDPCPEGNIPSEFRGENSISNVAQILLRHCFRILESGTGCFVKVASVHFQTKTISFGYLDRIGGLLGKLMMEIRHRGAYLAIQENFELLCKLIMNNTTEKVYHDLVWSWMIDYMGKINNMKVSVTRRSAGLPAGILSIIISPADEIRKSQFLEYVMERLLQVVNTDISHHDENKDLAQVHAMNVLRILVDDSHLTVLVSDYLATCFEICLQHFSSPYFPIRNCCSMLFTSLISKTFGSKKTAESTMFAREFFGKFPTLHDRLLQLLKTCIQDLEKGEINPVLYPTMSLLSKLRPSGIEKRNLEHSLYPFQLLVFKLTNAQEWKVREIAATAFASMLDTNDCVSAMRTIVEQLKYTNSRNDVHGSCLQIASILEMHLEILVRDFADLKPAIIETLTILADIVSDDRFAVGRSVYLDSIRKYHHLLGLSDQSDLFKTVFRLSRGICSRHLSTKYCPNYVFESSWYFVVLEASFKQKVDSLFEVLDKQNLMELDYCFKSIFCLAAEQRKPITNHAKIVELAIACVQNRNSDPAHLASSFRLLNERFDSQNPKLLLEALEYWFVKPYIPFDLVAILFELITRILISSFDLIDFADIAKLKTLFFSKAQLFTDPEKPIALRRTVAHCLLQLKVSFVPKEESFLEYGLLIDLFLDDEDEGIREMMGYVVKHYLNYNIPKTNALARKEFAHYMCIEYVSPMRLADVKLQYLVSFEVQFRIQSSGLLFDIENSNQYQEQAITILGCTKSLMDLRDRLSDLEQTDILKRSRQQLEKWLTLINEINYQWDSFDIEVFNSFIVLGCLGKVVEHFGKNSYLEQIKSLQLHPWSSNIIDGQKWNETLDICLGK